MAAAVKMKWSRDYGEIFGFDQDGARYFQDGLYFDKEGVFVENHSFNDPKAKEKALARSRNAEVDEVDDDDDEDDEDDEPDRPMSMKEKRQAERKPSPVAQNLGGKLDLKAWAIGTRKYPFPQVRDQLRRDHSFTATDKNSAITFLVDQGVVRERDLNSRK